MGDITIVARSSSALHQRHHTEHHYAKKSTASVTSHTYTRNKKSSDLGLLAFLVRLTLLVFLPKKTSIDATGSIIWIPKLAKVGSLWVHSKKDAKQRRRKGR